MFRILAVVLTMAALIAPKAHGSALADAFDKPVPDQSAPTLKTIPAQFLTVGGEFELNLSTYVTGMTGALAFGASSSNTAAVTVSVNGAVLAITPLAEGQADVTVTLGSASTAFAVTVLAGSPWSVSDGNVYRLAGNVGIGTADPDERLVVDGRVKAREIHLDTVTPADYVFDPDYELMTLDELKAHIRTHGHLPGIASGAEMQADGVDVGRLQTRLLEKVEELVLYTIEQHRTLSSQREFIDEQSQRLAAQQRYIESLENRLAKLETDR